jgi:hypothetical protein
MSMSKKQIWSAVALLLLSSFSAWAALTGDIEGFVTDATGAYIPGVSVAITSLETGAQRALVTNDRGNFAATLLPTGEYEVRAELVGFKPSVQRLLVKSAERASLNLTLEVGNLTQEVTVTETSVQLVNTTDAQVQISIDEKRIQALPLRTQDPLALATLSPGVVPVTPGNPYLNAGSFNTNGGRGRGNNITIDNIVSTDVTTTGQAGLETLSLDSIEEFKLITNNFNAEFGRNANSQVQIITKGGSNEFHGTVYEFLMNDKLNARDWFDTSGKASIVRRNQFGATAGGPIMRDRLFFFGHYEGVQKRGAGGTRVANIPSAAQLAAVTDPTSRAILEAAKLPAATSVDATGIGRVAQSGADSEKSNDWSVRLDSNLNGGVDTLTGRYSFQDRMGSSPSNTFLGSNLAGWGATSTNRPQNVHLGWTHVFSSRVVNEARVAYGRVNPWFMPESDSTIPRIAITGMSSFGTFEGMPQGRVQNTFQYSDTLAWARGRHNFKFGGDFHRIQANSLLDGYTRGGFTFASWDDFAAGRPLTFQQRFGSTVRGNRVSNIFLFGQDDFKVTPDFTLNLGFRMEIAGGVSEVNNILSNLDRRVTGTIGGAPAGPLGSFVIGGNTYDSNYNYQPRVGFAWNPNRGDWVVRGGYGITHDFIFLNPITNMRSQPPFIQRVDLTGINAFADGNAYANLFAGTGAIQAQGRAAVGQFNSTQTNFSSISPVDPELKNPQVQQWSLTIERQLAPNLAVKAGYVGTASRYLMRSRQLNPISSALVQPAMSEADEVARLAQFQALFAGATGSPSGGSNRLDPRFNSVSLAESSASSSFHGFEAEVNKRFSRGWQVQASYTWSKSIDDVSDFGGVLVNDTYVSQNPFNMSDSRGLSQFDVPHRLVVNHMLEPQTFRGLTGWAGKVLHGWALNGIFQTQSGFPTNIFAGTRLGITDAALSGNSTTANVVRANVVGDLRTLVFAPAGSAAAAGIPTPAARGVNSTAAQRNSNTSAYPLVQPLLGQYGTLGRNVLRLNGLTQFDWAVVKNTAVNEDINVQFRADFFNVFNNTSFAGFQNTLTSSGFGTYTATDTKAREIQLGLKLIW